MLNNMAENISDHLALRINERGEILYSTPSMNNFVSATKELSGFLRGFDEDDRKKFLRTFEDSLFFGRRAELDLSMKPEESPFEKRFLVKFYPTKYLGTKVVDVFFLDITEQLRRENFLKKQKEEAELLNKSQAAFFSNISHELRTPLTIILGYSEMLYEIVGPAERRMVSMIADSANYLLKLVNDILDISKITSRAVKVEPESVNIKLLVNNILEQFNSLVEKKGIKLESKLMICRENFVTDKTKLQRILTNLIGNAIKFTNEGVVRVLVKEEGSNVFLFAVEDTGIGIKKEYQDKVFERFVQIKDERSRVKFKKGTGLGLPLTKELVQLLGGRIWLQSEYGKGTTVYFTLKELNHSEEKQKGDKNG
jgi:signal transduction histidine kinase